MKGHKYKLDCGCLVKVSVAGRETVELCSVCHTDWAFKRAAARQSCSHALNPEKEAWRDADREMFGSDAEFLPNLGNK